MSNFGRIRQINVRQKRDIKHSQRPEREEPDVILSALGSQTLRWIKTHRSKGSTVKVAVTIADEKQLREIFDAFDFDKSGNVSLLEFSNALAYIRENRHFRKLSKALDHLEQTFIDMDADGDATVDYQEFTIGMTGSANGALDGLEQSDLHKLLAKFIEYARVHKRDRALEQMNKLDPGESDITRYELFQRIFTLHGGGDEDDRPKTTTEVMNETAEEDKPVSRPGTTMANQSKIDEFQLVKDVDDFEDELLRKRVIEERVALLESQNQRFEVLNLPPVKSYVKKSVTITPQLSMMSKTREANIKFRATKDAYDSVRGQIDWHDPKYRMSQPKRMAMQLSKSMPALPKAARARVSTFF